MRRICVIVIPMAATILLCSVAVGRPAPSGLSKGEYKNLKVLPKEISSKELSKIMVDDFSDALGVGCGFCHAQGKDSSSIDYTSDAKPEKEMARVMMRMTLRVNKRFFLVKHPALSNELVVTCNTCHNGRPRPDEEGK